MTGTELFILLLIFTSVILFVVVGISMFTGGWRSYEEKYVSGASHSLDSMFLTIPPQHLVYLSLLSGILCGFFVFALFGKILLGVIFAVPGLFIPRLIISSMKKKRDKKFVIQLVDALMSMSNSLKAGFSLTQAMALIEREMENPIAQEFRLVNTEVRLGVQLDEALHHLLERMRSQDLDLVVTSISISREIGGKLTEVFDNIADTIRERQKIEGKISALTAQGKAQAFIMCLLPVGLGFIISLINPGLMRPMYTTTPGIVMICIAAVMLGLGALVIRKIVAIDV